MKKLTKHALFLLLIAVLTVLTAIGLAQDRPVSIDAQIEKRNALTEALRRGGIEAATEIDPNYVGTHNPHPGWLDYDIEMLTEKSRAIIIGVPLKNRGRLNASGSSLNTVYDVLVEEVVKGDVEQGSTVKVALSGGKVSFSGGRTAEIRTPGFRKMINGRTYALYLNDSDNDGMFDLTAGPQGLLELRGTEVYSHAEEGRSIKEQVKDKSLINFLREARMQAGRYPR